MDFRQALVVAVSARRRFRPYAMQHRFLAQVVWTYQNLRATQAVNYLDIAKALAAVVCISVGLGSDQNRRAL